MNQPVPGSNSLRSVLPGRSPEQPQRHDMIDAVTLCRAGQFVIGYATGKHVQASCAQDCVVCESLAALKAELSKLEALR